MFKLAAVLVVFAALSGASRAQAESLDPKFFARAEIQARAPGAFALQAESLPFLRELAEQAPREREALLRRIEADSSLAARVKGFDRLSWPEKEEVLRAVFALECETLGIVAPELLIDSALIQGEAYFDFDPEAPGPGRVILNPKALAESPDPFDAILLLIHETRHSAQFQRSFLGAGDSALARGYEAAFRAQRDLKGQLSFCDFLTLLNEFEAFQFANAVLGALTGWKLDTLGMGTYLSQFDEQGRPRIDALRLFERFGAAGALDAFNELEKDQYRRLHP